ncbi:histone deacetylase HDT1 isoform X2 [Tripterygium wilfordii]|uniref:histone deacetylase HDT1 isoform X2 n=1 Tax=Tripterygium wilfordii TaxID=458696 RepID=UPI0018F816F9|nr:histone deacetylase HDT1 isoform X2 [Tripterygium wilfordii]
MAYSMEFWGVEVKAGEPLKVTPEEDTLIHVSQAALGESKKDKGKEAVPLYVKCGDQKLVIGTLSSENFPQVSFDLVFEKEFELSHNWKGGSVHFCGYKVPIPDEGDDYPGKVVPKGDNAAAKPQAAKPESSVKQVELVEPSKLGEGDSDEDSEDDSDEDSEDDSDEDDESGSDLMMSEDIDDSDEEEMPKKDEVVKKRPNDSALKTPASKKAKSATPQKTDGKKGGHTATPHPSKKAGKTPANGANPKAQTPKSVGQFSCNSCDRTFTKEVGLESHKKAKHAAN